MSKAKYTAWKVKRISDDLFFVKDMDRLEQIALEHGLCNCDEAYTKRGLTAPDCPWHAFAVQEAMEAYATEVARHNLERAADECKDIAVDAYESITSIEIELI